MRTLAPVPERPLAPVVVTPTFSIAIAAYQASATVGNAVRSALSQTYPAQEVIVVDDGSTDRIADALRPFEGRLTLIRKPNGGGASAKNAALAATSSDYMAILDADDVYHPRRLECLAELATSRPDLDLLTTDAAFVIDGAHVGRFATRTPFAIDDQRLAIFSTCFVGGWPAVRVAKLRAIGGFDERLRIAYDWDCWLRMILAGSSAGMVDVPYYEYRLHDESVSASRSASLWDRVQMLEKAQSDETLTPRERKMLARSLRYQRSRAVRAETLATPGSRPSRRLARLGVSRNVDTGARAGALLGAVLPQLARSIVRNEPTPAQRQGLPLK